MKIKRIFLSYAKEDFLAVSQFYEFARKNGYEVFMDFHDLKPGAWKPQIQRAIARSNVFLLFLSKHVMAKIDSQSGFVESEINYAYNIASMSSPTEYQIIPVRLDTVYRGDFRVSIFHQYDMFNDFDREAMHILSAIDNSSPIQRIVDRVSTYYFARDFVNAYAMLILLEEKAGWTVDLGVNKAAMLFNLGKCAEATELMQVLSIRDITSRASLILVNMLLAKKRIEEAARELEIARTRFPEDGEIKRLLASIRRSNMTDEFVLAPSWGTIYFTRDLIGDHSCSNYYHPEPYDYDVMQNAKPLVNVGTTIRTGEVYCLCLGMGGLFEVEAERSFTVKHILVQNGEFVVYEQPLLQVDFA